SLHHFFQKQVIDWADDDDVNENKHRHPAKGHHADIRKRLELFVQRRDEILSLSSGLRVVTQAPAAALVALGVGTRNYLQFLPEFLLTLPGSEWPAIQIKSHENNLPEPIWATNHERR